MFAYVQHMLWLSAVPALILCLVQGWLGLFQVKLFSLFAWANPHLYGVNKDLELEHVPKKISVGPLFESPPYEQPLIFIIIIDDDDEDDNNKNNNNNLFMSIAGRIQACLRCPSSVSCLAMPYVVPVCTLVILLQFTTFDCAASSSKSTINKNVKAKCTSCHRQLQAV